MTLLVADFNPAAKFYMEMESLSRRFRARPFVVIMAAFLLLGMILFLGAVLPFESLAFGNLVVHMAAITLLGALGALCTCLELHADGECFSLVVRLFGMPVLRRSVRGSAWHVIARPGRSFDSSPNDSAFYRIEVADDEGNRHRVMGEAMAFFFGVECL